MVGVSQAAVWYYRYHHPYFEVDEARDAVGLVLAMSDNGDCSPTGVQYPDGTWNEWADDPIVRQVSAEREAEDDAMVERMKSMPQSAMRTIRTPFTRKVGVGRRRVAAQGDRPGGHARVGRLARVTGRGRPETKIVGRVVEVKLPDDVLAALEQEAAELGWKRGALARWIIAERYNVNGGVTTWTITIEPTSCDPR
jgi:hypothetical protein